MKKFKSLQKEDYDFDFDNCPNIPLYALTPIKRKKPEPPAFDYSSLICGQSPKPIHCNIDLRYTSHLAQEEAEKAAEKLRKAAAFADKCPGGLASSQSIVKSDSVIMTQVESLTEEPGVDTEPTQQFPEKLPGVMEGPHSLLEKSGSHNLATKSDASPSRLVEPGPTPNVMMAGVPQEMMTSVPEFPASEVPAPESTQQTEHIPLSEMNPLQRKLCQCSQPKLLGGGSLIEPPPVPKPPSISFSNPADGSQSSPNCQQPSAGCNCSYNTLSPNGSSKPPPLSSNKLRPDPPSNPADGQQPSAGCNCSQNTVSPNGSSKPLPPLPSNKPRPDPSFMNGLTRDKPKEPFPPCRSCPPGMHIIQKKTTSEDASNMSSPGSQSSSAIKSSLNKCNGNSKNICLSISCEKIGNSSSKPKCVTSETNNGPHGGQKPVYSLSVEGPPFENKSTSAIPQIQGGKTRSQNEFVAADTSDPSKTNIVPEEADCCTTCSDCNQTAAMSKPEESALRECAQCDDAENADLKKVPRFSANICVDISSFEKDGPKDSRAETEINCNLGQAIKDLIKKCVD